MAEHARRSTRAGLNSSLHNALKKRKTPVFPAIDRLENTKGLIVPKVATMPPTHEQFMFTDDEYIPHLDQQRLQLLVVEEELKFYGHGELFKPTKQYLFIALWIEGAPERGLCRIPHFESTTKKPPYVLAIPSNALHRDGTRMISDKMK
jgi:hypothetical protein